jgi:hypothetical protein
MYNMISVCDQFLINDVRNIFELKICEKIFIRNCGEILEFAFHYNCEILKNVCMEFISNNLSRILESPALDSLNPDILNEISKFYRTYFDLDQYRMITPDSNAISDEDLMEFIKDFDTNSNCSNEDEIAVLNEKKLKNKPKHKLNKLEIEKRNYEREAVKTLSKESTVTVKNETSVKNISTINPTSPRTRESWMKIDSKKETPDKKKMVFAAIKSNETMKASVLSSMPDSNLVCLKTMLSSPISVENSASVKESNLRNSITLGDFTPSKKDSKSKKNRRYSENDFPLKSCNEVQAEILSKSENVWNINKETVHKGRTSDIQLTPNKLDITPQVTPKKLEKDPVLWQSPKEFSNILRTELKDKLNYEKTISKSLALTQIEEKAIEELKIFYNVAGVFDENIKIFRKHYMSTKTNFASWHSGLL